MNFVITNDLFKLSFSICATSELYLNYKLQFGSPQLFFILYKLPINNLPEKEDPPKCFGYVYLKKRPHFFLHNSLFLQYQCNISSIMTNLLRKISDCFNHTVVKCSFHPANIVMPYQSLFKVTLLLKPEFFTKTSSPLFT